MEIKFYCQDARKPFLEPDSVDLFLTHPPFLNRLVAEYGGDLSSQIQNSDTVENFAKSISDVVGNMETALRDSGAILLILPNTRTFFHIVKFIIQNTNLVINRDIIWNFEQSEYINELSGSEINHILYITKNKDVTHQIKNLKSLVIDQNWTTFDNFDSLPEKMIEELILVFSKEGDVVADPMGGTGTVAAVSLKNNRKAIYNDVSPLQVDLAKKRLYDTIGYKEILD
ncbi:MAG: DNA methyltransferase [bacterium]